MLFIPNKIKDAFVPNLKWGIDTSELLSVVLSTIIIFTAPKGPTIS